MKAIDLVLTALVNNDKIINSVIDDISERFKTKLDKEKLVNYLATYEHNQNTNTVNIW